MCGCERSALGQSGVATPSDSSATHPSARGTDKLWCIIVAMVA